MPNLTTSSAVDAMMQAADAAGIRTAIGLGTAATATLSALLSDFTYTAATRILSSASTGASVTLPNADGTNSGLMTSANFTKLSGIATGATANSSDATLLARANHTGAQASSTILFAATKRLTGRNTAAGGTGEEVTADQVLDWIGTAVQGDIIYRDSSAYSRLAAPAANSILRFNGNSTIPAWSTQWTISSAGTMAWSQVAALTANTPAITIAQTWNNVSTTFVGASMTITDTTSASGSLALQILGGASGTTNLLQLDKAGLLKVGDGSYSSPSVKFGGVNAGIYYESATAGIGFSRSGLRIGDASTTGFHIDTSLGTGVGFYWSNFGGNNYGGIVLDSTSPQQTAIRQGTAVQSLAIYKTYTAGTPDYERLRIYSTAGANPFVIAAEINGTGVYRDISIQAGGNEKLLIQQSTGASCIFKNLTKLEVWGALDISGTFTVGDGYNFALGSTNGTKIGSTITQKIGFWNATPVVQPTNANQAAVAGTAGATYTATEQTLINALKTLVNQLRADLVTVGLIKGS